ncbi:MAG: OmpA family protein [Desulfobacterales bacterium]|nr:OmpA family protein [Desulfobacterales bacterium]
MKKTWVNFIVLLSLTVFLSNGIAAEDLKVIVRNAGATLNYQILDDGKLLVSVLDEKDEPIRGLKREDFIVGSGIRKAEVLSATPLETTEAVPLNVVLVLDNSFSMRERRAVKPLLTAMDEFFKTVRPIDNIHLVVFDNRPALKVGSRSLHTKTFNSSDINRLHNFLEESLKQNSTSKTYLYEAMAAGVDIIRGMPAKEQKFMVVFSDGEDLNSSLSTKFIEEQARDLDNFEAFCVDYMPGAKLNRFLTAFAKTHDGRIWKATSASELLPIFQAFTTTLRYRYVVSYRLLNSIKAEPGELNFEMLTMVDGSPLSSCLFFETGKSEIPSDYVLLKSPEDAAAFDAGALTTAMDRYRNILNLVGQNLAQNSEAAVKIVGCNSDSGIEKGNLELSGRRAGSVISYLQEIWGIDAARIELETRNLPADPTPPEVVGTGPENQRVEIHYDSPGMRTLDTVGFLVETSGRRELKIEANIFSETGISDWDLTLYSDDQPLKKVSGQGEIETGFTFAWQELDAAELRGILNLGIQLRTTDRSGAVIETEKVMLPVTISLEKWDDKLVRAPGASLVLEPKTVTIEELTTIDSSPFLNYIYFDTADSEIPARYITFKNQGDTQSFDESKLEGTLEKHYNVLNILGRRLTDHPDGRIQIVGCNSNRGEEQGKTDLSRSRAEAVRAYLKYIWGIDGSRMEIAARNQPAAASSSGSMEGRQENQRVEVYSESPALLDVVKSTYVQEICDTENFLIQPRINSAYEIDRWTIKLNGDGRSIESLSGDGDIEPAYRLSLTDVGLGKLSAYQTVTADIEVTDRKGQTASAKADADVRFIKREERSAQKEGYRVLEKYALILFDFNRAEIREKNRDVIDRIVDRIKEVPTARISIVGHTDIIGQEAYNLDLSSRRAKAAYDMILAGGVPEGDNISYNGIGPHDALFDNELPEGRALNRTVTVTLEYEQN